MVKNIKQPFKRLPSMTDTYILALHHFPLINTTCFKPRTNERTNDHGDIVVMMPDAVRID